MVLVLSFPIPHHHYHPHHPHHHYHLHHHYIPTTKDQRLGFESSRSEIEDRIKLHMSQLEEQREQVGLIPTPSSVLKEAEKHLAEVW